MKVIMINTKNVLVLFAMIIVTITSANAEQKIAQGDYELHYNAFPANFLPKEIALRHQIPNSRNNGVIFVKVLNVSQNPAASVIADIEITARNLLNQKKEVKLITVQEDNHVVSYLGSFTINNQEDVNFTIVASPKDTEETITAQFFREFWTD